jgi:hypothetical protein
MPTLGRNTTAPRRECGSTASDLHLARKTATGRPSSNRATPRVKRKPPFRVEADLDATGQMLRLRIELGDDETAWRRRAQEERWSSGLTPR